MGDSQPSLLGDTVLGQPFMRALVVGMGTFGLWVLFGVIGSALFGPEPVHYGISVLQALGALLGFAVLTGLIEGRLPNELSPWPGLLEMLLGLLGGAVVVVLVGIALWIGNWIVPTVAEDLKPLRATTAVGLLTTIAGAVGWIVLQELLLRAVIARVLELYLGSVFTVVAMTVGFALVYAFVPGIGPIAVLAVALWGGVMQTTAWMRTRRIWLPVGLRLGWYALLSGVLGAPSWGHPPTRSVLDVVSKGPEWLTGGAAGLGGSILLGGAALCVGLMLLVSAREHRLLGSAFTMRQREGLEERD